MTTTTAQRILGNDNRLGQLLALLDEAICDLEDEATPESDDLADRLASAHAELVYIKDLVAR